MLYTSSHLVYLTVPQVCYDLGRTSLRGACGYEVLRCRATDPFCGRRHEPDASYQHDAVRCLSRCLQC